MSDVRATSCICEVEIRPDATEAELKLEGWTRLGTSWPACPECSVAKEKYFVSRGFPAPGSFAGREMRELVIAGADPLEVLDYWADAGCPLEGEAAMGFVVRAALELELDVPDEDFTPRDLA